MRSDSGLNCVICGVGGQGNVLASRLIAQVLLARDEHVKTAETIGMAQATCAEGTRNPPSFLWDAPTASSPSNPARRYDA